MKSGVIKKLIVLILVFDLIMIVYLSNKKPAVSVENAQLDLLPNIRFGLDLLPSSTINIFSVFEIPTGTPEKTEEPDKEDGSRIMIDVWDEETGASEMELEEYVFHVLAGEMPASYEPEALKAQAVAARTFALKQFFVGTSCKSGHTVCTSPNCCQAFADTEALKRSWGNKYETYCEKLRRAVEETRGEVMTSEGKLISALYHASSGGKTEDCEAVFAVALPYLVSVDSEGEEAFSEYSSDKSFAISDFCNMVNEAYPQAGLTDPSRQVAIWARTDSGRVKLVQLGGTVISGQQLRKLLNLRSTNFTFSFSQDSVTITCLGFGHGVGMSQCGADAMAKQGIGYKQILEHYYTGIELVDYSQLKNSRNSDA